MRILSSMQNSSTWWQCAWHWAEHFGGAVFPDVFFSFFQDKPCMWSIWRKRVPAHSLIQVIFHIKCWQKADEVTIGMITTHSWHIFIHMNKKSLDFRESNKACLGSHYSGFQILQLDSWGEEQGESAAEREATVLVWCSYQRHSDTDRQLLFYLSASTTHEFHLHAVLRTVFHFLNSPNWFHYSGEFQWLTFWSCFLLMISVFSHVFPLKYSHVSLKATDFAHFSQGWFWNSLLCVLHCKVFEMIQLHGIGSLFYPNTYLSVVSHIYNRNHIIYEVIQKRSMWVHGLNLSECFWMIFRKMLKIFRWNFNINPRFTKRL